MTVRVYVAVPPLSQKVVITASLRDEADKLPFEPEPRAKIAEETARKLAADFHLEPGRWQWDFVDEDYE